MCIILEPTTVVTPETKSSFSPGEGELTINYITSKSYMHYWSFTVYFYIEELTDGGKPLKNGEQAIA